MKKMTLIATLGLSIIVILAIIAAFEMGEKSPILAEGVVRLEESLTSDARGIGTLFIIVHDEASAMPMPYGAIKETLEKDAVGDFYKFRLTKENLRVMNPEAPPPAKFTIRARLDLDGQGGRPQPGDLVGETHGVDMGSRNVEIIINQRVEE